MEIILQQMIDLNNNLERILGENRSIRNNEREKLHSIKQISFQKRKQLLTHTKRLYILSIDERHLTGKTLRTTREIIRLNNILHHSQHTENVGVNISIPKIFNLGFSIYNQFYERKKYK